ncbi:suf-domain-containing protein [Ceraceosorus bombacis]|uniref:mRNA 3'-end-processing protein RNA14 n=1 Tax=Ceraceosorus bombacis TaxID=401625 RepID=A0A0N7LBA8_9BASI|nr:suf-domain-containing protein [Ceraceosorus bombacis]
MSGAAENTDGVQAELPTDAGVDAIALGETKERLITAEAHPTKIEDADADGEADEDAEGELDDGITANGAESAPGLKDEGSSQTAPAQPSSTPATKTEETSADDDSDVGMEDDDSDDVPPEGPQTSTGNTQPKADDASSSQSGQPDGLSSQQAIEMLSNGTSEGSTAMSDAMRAAMAALSGVSPVTRDDGQSAAVKQEATAAPAESTFAPTPDTAKAAPAPAPASAPASAPAAPAAAKGPEERRNELTLRVTREPRDGDAWLLLIENAIEAGDIDAARARYEDFFKVFPNASRQWQNYAQLELSLSHTTFPLVESIFTRCLRTTPSVDLWSSYLSYTRRVNPLPPSSVPTEEREKARRTIEGAYEFALKFIGHSRDAGEVWREYIQLLKDREVAPNNQWQAGQKMDDIRRAYQQAVAIPLSNVEAVWREYDQYETGLNRITAKKFLAERSPAYMTARSALKEMRSLTEILHRPILPRVPTWAQSALQRLQQGSDAGAIAIRSRAAQRERGQAESWKRYLKWEESNPLELEDLTTLHTRIIMAYRKATMHMRFFAEIWYMAAQYLEGAERQDDAKSWLRIGMGACPGSFLLRFAYIELCEATNETSACASVFAELLEHVHGQIEAVQEFVKSKHEKIDEEGVAAAAEAAAKRKDSGEADENVGGDEREGIRKAEEVRTQRKKVEDENAKPVLEELKESAALVWIKQMHLVRRNGGVRPCRAIFGKARKSPHCTWQVYEANALMEYHCSKDVGVATRVFEVALKTFGSDEAFVVRYLDFLISINDDNNARALFERTVNSFEPNRARPLWDRWCDYEYSFGDRAAIQRLEQRLREVYPDEPAIKRFVDRNTYMDLDVISSKDLGFEASLDGANAADRAVAASRMAFDDGSSVGAGMAAANAAAESARAVTGAKREFNEDAPGAIASNGQVERAAGQKRARFEDDAPGGRRRSVSPTPRAPIPTRSGDLVPVQQQQPMAYGNRGAPLPPQGGPQGHLGGRGPPPAAAVPAPQAPPFSEPILFFMDILPGARFFGPPLLPVDEVINCLREASVALPPPGNGGGDAYGRAPAGQPGWANRANRTGGGRPRGGRRF